MQARTILSVSLLSVVLGGAPTVLGQNHHEPAEAGPIGQVPLYDNLGDHHYPVTTDVPSAQAYFDQGLRLYYAFNHAEGIRAFREAQRLDPSCAMCWWGEALAWGPNINLAMDRPSALAAYAALQGAVERQANASEKERALIQALSVRYAADPPADRKSLDEAYEQAMSRLAERWPDDPEIVVLRGEAVMDTRPWDYWQDDGQPQPGIAGALAGFEKVMQQNPDHPGACHFYIHAVEQLYPERAVPCAERLAALMPGAGHIVHMPGHIYIRVGRYLDAIHQNEHAVHADETFIADQRPGAGMYTVGYYPHNYDFLAFAASMIGRSDEAITSAKKVQELIPAEMYGEEGMDFLQHWSSRALQMQIRFARWQDILATPAPPASRPHALALWHYARGRALAGRGDVAGARDQLAALNRIAGGAELNGVRMEFNASRDLLAVASAVLTGWIEAAAGDYDKAVAAMEQAVRREDALLYGEPPEWSIPTREDLGAVLLLADRPKDVERAFREDLAHFPDNGWSLYGLAEALERQDRREEAAAERKSFQRIWATADVTLPLG